MDSVTIVLIIGLIICVGVGTWLFSKKNDLTRGLLQATTRNERLSEELEALTQTNVTLERDLSQSNTRCTDLEQRNTTLDSNLSEAHTRTAELERNNATLDSGLAQANTQLTELGETNARLENDLSQAHTRHVELERTNATLESDLNRANEEIERHLQALEEANQLNARLSGELAQAREQIETLETELTQAREQCATLETELTQAREQCATLETELAQAREQGAHLETQLAQQRQRCEDLESNLSETREQIATLETELEQVRQHRTSLETELAQEHRRCEHLETNLAQVAQSNQAALWGLYLCEVSLQVCGSALQSESSRSKRLIENYRGLEGNYQDFREKYREKYEAAIQAHRNFRDEVQRKARRRMVRKGIGVALALIPGVGLIDLLSDLGEIASAAGEVALDTDEITSALSEVQESVDSAGAEVKTLEESEFLSPSTGPDAMPIIALTPEAQSTVKERFLEQELDPDSGTAPTTPPPFVAETFQCTEELVDSVSEDERRRAMAIAKTANNFRQLGIETHDYRTDQGLQEAEDAST